MSTESDDHCGPCKLVNRHEGEHQKFLNSLPCQVKVQLVKEHIELICMQNPWNHEQLYLRAQECLSMYLDLIKLNSVGTQTDRRVLSDSTRKADDVTMDATTTRPYQPPFRRRKNAQDEEKVSEEPQQTGKMTLRSDM